MNVEVLVALVAAVPATVAAVAAWRAGTVGRENRTALATGNGQHVGQYVVDLSESIDRLSAASVEHHAALAEHDARDNVRFDTIDRTQGEIMEYLTGRDKATL